MTEQALQPTVDTKTMAKSENFGLDMFSARGLQGLIHLSNYLAESTIIPKTFQKRPSNVLIALNMAQRMNADPMMVMQNMYIVYDNPSWSSKFLIACFNTCGRFTSIKYKFTGTPGTDDYSCTAYATEKATGELVESTTVTIAMAKAEGWYDKKGSKWQTMPQLMMQYRAAAFLIRATAPEISMGLQTAEELEDVYIDVPQEPSFAEEQQRLKQEIHAISSQPVKVDMPVQETPVQEPAIEPQVQVPVTPAQPARPAWMKQ